MAHLKRSLNAITAFGLSALLSTSMVATPALAATSEELQSQVDAAKEQLYAYYDAAELADMDLTTATSNLNTINDQISQTEEEIAQKTTELEESQAELSNVVSSQYKNSSSNLLALLFNSDSWETLLSNITYASKIALYQQDVITTTRDLKASLESDKATLEDQKTQQETLVAEQQEKSEAANAAAQEAQAYYDGLATELQEAIAAEEEAERKAAEEAAAQAAAEAQARANAEAATTNNTTADTTNSNNSSNTNSNSNNSSSNNSGIDAGTPSRTSSASTMVNRALSVIGTRHSMSGYRWTGDKDTSYFTCSGLVDFALGFPTNTHSPETYYASVRYVTTNIDELNYGDLVFGYYAGRAPGHVGIYIGNGQMVDSSTSGVAVRNINPSTFMGGGPFL